MRNAICYRLLISLICIMMAIFVPLSVCASVGEAVDVNRKGSITVTIKNDEKVPVAEVPFRIYRVADVSADGEYTLTSKFSAYSVSLDDLDTESMASLAMTLSAYISRDGIQPEQTGVTNKRGVVKFSDVSVGLYIVTGDKTKMDDTLYYPQPFMLSIPSATDEKGIYEYDVAVDAKYETHVDEDDTPIERRVLKIWKDEDGDERPNEITVQLLRDDTVFDEVVLNESNNWRYVWSELDPEYTWQIVEKEVPADYTVSVSRTGVTFTVTNRYNPPPVEPTPTPDTPPTPTEPNKLPQTGQMWWPVPVLGAAGIALCGAGIAFKYKSKHD